jgi:hypothetical protein
LALAVLQLTFNRANALTGGLQETDHMSMADVADELAAMQVFSDAALRAAVEPSMSRAEQRRLALLNSAAGERALTAAEHKEQQALILAYDHSVLRRAKAMAILAQRGHDLSEHLQVHD